MAVILWNVLMDIIEMTQTANPESPSYGFEFIHCKGSVTRIEDMRRVVFCWQVRQLFWTAQALDKMELSICVSHQSM